jgi:hypothetical protein
VSLGCGVALRALFCVVPGTRAITAHFSSSISFRLKAENKSVEIPHLWNVAGRLKEQLSIIDNYFNMAAPTFDRQGFCRWKGDSQGYCSTGSLDRKEALCGLFV